MKIRSLCLAAFCAAVGFASTLCGAPSDVGYAPQDTDLIVRLDGQKIRASKLFAALRQDESFRSIEAEAQKELAKTGVSFDDLLATDIHIFMNSVKVTSDRPVAHIIARNSKPLANLFLAQVDASRSDAEGQKTIRKVTIGGKEARLVKNEDISLALIAISDDAVQLSVNPAADCSILPAGTPSGVALAVKPDAMISIAHKMNAEAGAALVAQCPEEFRPLVKGLQSSAINLFDAGDAIRFEAELVYSTPEQTQMVQEQIRGLISVMIMSMSEKEPEKAATLKQIKITGTDTVKISFSCKNAELLKLIME